MKSAIYAGKISHRRYTPKPHEFYYNFFMWFLNLDELDRLPSLGRWFSARKWAASRFYRPDYLGDPARPLGDSVRERMEELTGRPVGGQVCGLMNLRTFGMYFSPVNFYYGFDGKERFTHFLAEVSNIPWNERHQYGFYVADGKRFPTHAKAFHVSPFNPDNQFYRWKIGEPGDRIGVGLAVHDERGRIFSADLDLVRYPLSMDSVKRNLLKKPAMTAFIVSGIYYEALRIFLKGVPYIPYRSKEEMI